MTRANIVIVHGSYPKKAFLEKGSDGYPSEVIPELVKFLVAHVNNSSSEERLYKYVSSDALVTLMSELYLTLGQIGNFYYAYEVDLVKGTIKAWESKTRWVNAPADWEKRGWVCWLGSNGKYGYTNWVKGKIVFSTDIETLLKDMQFEVEGEVHNVIT